MKPRKDSVSAKSLQDLKALLKAKSFLLPVYRIPEPPPAKNLPPETEANLFSRAMQGVLPISRENCVERAPEFKPPQRKDQEESMRREEAEVLSRLANLVEKGAGFTIADTPEYIEGTSYDVPPEIARRLHGGTYSIQAHLDLHGLNTHDAREVLEKFLKWAVLTGKRGLLIIHGRGLASPEEPVLKTKVVEWLTRGAWRKWVAAYASARLHDGGTGATYVLLRSRPVSKREKRQRKVKESKGTG